MLENSVVAESYPLREAADLIGLSADALRKRLQAGRIDGRIVSGSVLIDAAAIEQERADILRRMTAIDGRPGRSPRDFEQEEVERLRAETARLRAVIASMAAAARASNDATKAAVDAGNAQLDALRQYLVPDHLDPTSGTTVGGVAP